MNLNRIFIFAAGTVSLLLAVNPPESLLIYGGYIWGFFSSTFLLPLYGGLFWKKATKEGAIASFVVGLLTISFFMIRTFLVVGAKNAMVHPALPGVMASAMTFYFVSQHFHHVHKGRG